MLLEIKILNFQIQDLGIASLSCIISLYYASITALYAPAAKLLLAICCSCSYTSPLLPARLGQARSLQGLAGAGTAAAPTQPGCSCSQGQQPLPSQTPGTAPVASAGRQQQIHGTGWGFSGAQGIVGNLPCQGCLPGGQGCLPGGQLCACHHRDWQLSLLLSCTCLCTELKKILLTLPLQLCTTTLCIQHRDPSPSYLLCIRPLGSNSPSAFCFPN